MERIATTAGIPSMKLSIRIRHVAWRPQPDGTGRPRYVPSPEDRKLLDEKGRDLRHGPDGAWFTAEECLTWAAAKQAELEERRKLARAPKPRRLRAAGAAPVLCVANIVARWFEGEQFGAARMVGKRRITPLKPSTQRYYRGAAKVAETHDDGHLWATPVRELSTKVLNRFLTAIHEERGLAQANAVKRSLSAAWSDAIRRGDVAHNPFAKAKIATPPARWRAGSIAEMQALIAAADRIGRADVGDAIMLALFTGQRQGDRLAMRWEGRTDDGRLLIRQGKTGAVVVLPEDARLAARLSATRERRRTWTVQPLEVLVYEATRRPWVGYTYTHAFADVRAAAVAGDEEHGAPPCPSLADFRDQDLRDTAVTWLALAGNTVPQICAVTGHELESANQVLKHYLGQHPELARSALKHLDAWLTERGAKL